MGTIPLTPGGIVSRLLQYMLQGTMDKHLSPREKMMVDAGFNALAFFGNVAVTELLISALEGKDMHRLSRAQRLQAVQISRGWKSVGTRRKHSIPRVVSGKPVPVRTVPRPPNYGIPRIGGGVFGVMTLAGPMLIMSLGGLGFLERDLEVM